VRKNKENQERINGSIVFIDNETKMRIIRSVGLPATRNKTREGEVRAERAGRQRKNGHRTVMNGKSEGNL